jgi:hypothetical protein
MQTELTKDIVPEWLKASSFYRDLGDDAGKFTVDLAKCAVSSSPTTTEELLAVLRTCSFWGVDVLPNDVREFCLANHAVVTQDILNEFEILKTTYPDIITLLELLGLGPDKIKGAIETGRLDLFSFARGPFTHEHWLLAARLGESSIVRQYWFSGLTGLPLISQYNLLITF